MARPGSAYRRHSCQYLMTCRRGWAIVVCPGSRTRLSRRRSQRPCNTAPSRKCHQRDHHPTITVSDFTGLEPSLSTGPVVPK